MKNSFHINEKLPAERYFEYHSRRQLLTSGFGPYSILNLGIKRLLFGGRGSLSLNANNILQEESHDAIDHYEHLNQYSYWNYYTPGVRLGLSWRFGRSSQAKIRTQPDASEKQKRAN